MLLGWLQRGRRELSGSPSLKCVRQIATEIDKSEVGMYIGARRLHGAVTRAVTRTAMARSQLLVELPRIFLARWKALILFFRVRRSLKFQFLRLHGAFFT